MSFVRAIVPDYNKQEKSIMVNPTLTMVESKMAFMMSKVSKAIEIYLAVLVNILVAESIIRNFI